MTVKSNVGNGKGSLDAIRQPLLAVLCCTIAWIIMLLYDHGMLPQFPRGEGFLIGESLPSVFTLRADYISNPIWQLHGVRGSGAWFRSFEYSCEFQTAEKVRLKNPNSWTKGNGRNIPKDAENLLPPDLFQGIKKSGFEYWYRDNYPAETTVLIHKKGSDHYYLFSDGAS